MRDKRLLLGIALGGLLGGAIGYLAGGLIGALSCDWNVKEAGCLESSVYGAVIGNSIMIPIGVQVANWQRGNPSLFLLTLLVAGGIAAAGLAAYYATGVERAVIALTVLQLVSCVAIQWRSLRSITVT